MMMTVARTVAVAVEVVRATLDLTTVLVVLAETKFVEVTITVDVVVPVVSATV